MKPQEFTALNDFLSRATLSDSLLALHSVVAWLDPCVTLPEPLAHEDDMYMGGGDDWSTIGMAWEIVRECVPEVYAETTLALRQIPNARQLADHICDIVNQHLVGGAMNELFEMQFGIPFFGAGIDLRDRQFFADPRYTALIEVYAMLDVNIAATPNYSVPEGIGFSAKVADVLAASLREQGSSQWHDLAWLLDWMFSQTGNSVANYTTEDIYEMGAQLLEWSVDNLSFNNLMHEEADEIIQDAMRGLRWLMRNPALQTELKTNFQYIAKHLKKENPDDHSSAQRLSRRLRWTDCLEQPDEHRPDTDAEVFPLRRADAA